MAFISVEEAQPGLVLESNVQNNHGQLLVTAGTTLTERHLTLFRSWGITRLPISSDGATLKESIENKQVTPEAQAKAEESLSKIFIFVPEDDAIMKELFRQCVVRKARLLS